MIKVFGIDPGLTRCGLAVIEINEQKRMKLVEVSVDGTEPSKKIEDRLFYVHKMLIKWLDKYEPNAVSIERVFYNKNISTAIATAQVIGLAMVEAKKRNIPVETFTPPQIKSSVTGYGKANKESVTKMVTKLLNITKILKPPDAADAIATAITYAWSRNCILKDNNIATKAQQQWMEAEIKLKDQGK